MAHIKAEVAVLGSGPGGYTAAFRAADLGKKVVLIEKYANIGGVCLNVGCIPSKALLHTAKIMDEAKEFSNLGISFSNPTVDLDRLRAWKDGVITRLTSGLKGLAKQRKVEIVQGFGKFTGPHQLEVEGSEKITVEFEKAIIAVGSRPVDLPFLPKDPRVVNSTGALELREIPKDLLVIGGGIIGMEMGTVYAALGSKVHVVEWLPAFIPGADKDLVNPFVKRMKKHFGNLMLETKVTQVEAKDDGLWVSFEGKQAPQGPQRYDGVLSAVGRVPNGKLIDADKAGVKVDDRGFIAVDAQMRTNVPHIFAIGDVVGNPMLAHKAVPQGKVAAEVIAGHNHSFSPLGIPSVAYTDPEIAWVGMTENEAKEKGIELEKGVFPWAASGRSLAEGRDEGMTKLLFEKGTERLVGAGIVGPHAGDLIGELCLALEMGCDPADLALTIHPHPTFIETIAQAAEAFEGTITDLYMPKKEKK